MMNISLPVPAAADFSTVASVVERSCDQMGLRQTMKDTLGRYPGCVHWHYSRPGQSGTLEVTAWPAERKLWLTVHDGRRAGWIDECLPGLKVEMKRRLAALAPLRKKAQKRAR
ncbi:MAG TPA: hypothetical protein VGY48_10050 [Vicinamibacterales bacterium]|jgi:hypothetical protein|nr:hypothetical protein [Vicinamibacterales bacterium]